MAEKKTWEQLSKREKTIGMVGLGVLAVLGLGIVSAVADAVNGPSSSRPPSNPQVQSVTNTEPVTTYKDITETESIPFEKVTQNDSSLDIGTSVITTVGVKSIRAKTFKLTLVDGKETFRVETKSEVTTPPVNEVTSIGTKQPYIAPAPASDCDPNYTDCVPIASDVDCGGGSGNGPAYFYGTAQVIGTDIYDLDRDNDGIACE